METFPTGTVTFLFTDIEGSTTRWERDQVEMDRSLVFHDAILHEAIAAHRGIAFKIVGDAFQAAFHNAPDALAAAIDAQRRLAETPPDIDPLRVRMALHTGAAEMRNGDYAGAGLSRAPCLNRLARILSAGYGGQTLLSLATHQLVRDALPPAVALRDLGTHRLKDLQQPERLFQVVTDDDPARQHVFPPLKTLDSRPNNLPIQPTGFVGRDRERDELERQILSGTARLVTLTGPGGIGKSRLALEALAAVHDRFPDGTFMVHLDAVRGSGTQAADRLVAAISQVVGLRDLHGESPLDTLVEDLRQKQMLVLLDNFEHLLDAAPVVARLAAACPQLMMVATSRTPLHIRAEWEFPVPAFATPDPKRLPPFEDIASYPSVQLFAERARAVKPSFELTPGNASVVAAICARLDGLPLAIELAASRVKLFSPRMLLDRLSLDLLSRASRDAPERQQTLRNTIAWSYDLLEPAEQALFRRLAVFVGGATLSAVGEVLGESTPDAAADLDMVFSLVEQSLVVLDSDRVGALDDEPRVAMLETVREFGAQLVDSSGEATALRKAHATYYLAMAEQSQQELSGSAQALWLAKLEDDYGNVRAALGWALDQGDFAVVLRASAALRLFWTRRGYLEEGRSFLDRAMRLGAKEPTRERAEALTVLATMACDQDDYSQARSLHESALGIWLDLDGREGRARTLNNLGRVALTEGRYEEARTCFQECLELCEELGDSRGAAFARDNLGDVASAQGRFAEALALHERSLRDLSPLRDLSSDAYSYHKIGVAHLGLGDHEQAGRFLDRSRASFRDAGDRFGEGYAVHGLALLAEKRDNLPQAESRYREALGLHAEVRNRLGMIEGLEGLAGVVVGRAPGQAAEWLAVAARWREAIGAPCPPAWQPAVDTATGRARSALGDDRFDETWRLAGAHSLDDAVEMALRIEA